LTSTKTAARPSSNSKWPRLSRQSDWTFRPRGPRFARGVERGGIEAGQALRAGDHRIAARSRSGECITLARVVKTQDAAEKSQSNSTPSIPDRFREGMRLWALPKTQTNERREVQVEDLWPHKGMLVLKFAASRRFDAELLVGAELQLPRSERAVLEPGWTYLSDLIGCKVFDGEREVGPIEDVNIRVPEKRRCWL